MAREGVVGIRETSMNLVVGKWRWYGRRAWMAVLFLGSVVAANEPSAAFRFADVDSRSLGLWEGDRPVLVYRHGIQSKPGVPADRDRGSYVHPLYGLDGEVLTDDFPRDHYHHRGLFWAWPHIRVGSVEHDLWMLRGIEDRFITWRERSIEAGKAKLGVANAWHVGDKKVLDEQVQFTVFPATAEGRVIDVELTWTAVAEPVILWGAAGKSYGGLSLRFAPRKQTVITTADGRQPKDLNLTRLEWADLSAQFQRGDTVSGIAVFVDRRHPGFPPMWITRHYGFLGVGWPGVEPFTFQPGQPVSCRYRLWIHRGSFDPAAAKGVKQK
jgi:hypothetical protein